MKFVRINQCKFENDSRKKRKLIILIKMNKYLISDKTGITDSINNNFGKMRIDSYNPYLLKKY